MNRPPRIFAIFKHLVLYLAVFFAVCSCHSVIPEQPLSVSLKRVFPAKLTESLTFDASIIASSVVDTSQGYPLVIVSVSNGEVVAIDATTGRPVWNIPLPSSKNQEVQLISTPIVIKNRLFLIYQTLEKGTRINHRLTVINLEQKKLDEHFQLLDLKAEVPSADPNKTVKFNPATAYSHSALKYVANAGTKQELLYVALGNAGDIQPFHGWLFELDLAAWQEQGADKAIKNILVTTPEAECPVTMTYGTQEMICGGGIWTPGGPQIYSTPESYELYVPTGNGQVDIARHDFANSIMRVKPGLKFDPECDAKLCNNFNPKQPDLACISSCKNLFIPRLKPNDAPLKPANKECDNRTFWECLAWMDYDLGGSTQLKITLENGKSVLVHAGKDGAAYLIDADHLGTQYDRLQIVELCGTATDMCKAHWMGMIVTQPVLSYHENDPVVVIPTFEPDKTHSAGVVALKIVLENGKPLFKNFWQFPAPTSPQALQMFRSHPSLPVISKIGSNKEDVVWVVDIAEHAKLYGIRIKDGKVLVEQTLLGTGRQLSIPLLIGDTLYLSSSESSTGKTFIEAYQIMTP